MSNKKHVKVCIFDKSTSKDIVVERNGDAILDGICTSCHIYENIDGTHELDAVFIVDKEGLYKNISDESILKVRVDYGNEIFRIARVTKQEKQIIVYARQITISETLDMWIEDIRPTNTSGLSALNNLKENSIGKKDIDVFSDIDSTATAYYQQMNMYQAIHDCDQSFITRWGGQVQRRGYSLIINKSIGSDRGVTIRSNKSLTGFEANTNIDNVVTRIKAVGFDGIYAGKYVDSPLINNYSAIKTRKFKYEDVKVKDENNPDEGYDTLEEAQAELLRLAELEFTQNHVDELRADYLINFIYLEQTEEYKNFIQAERVYIGDTVQVYEEKHNVNINVMVISKRYDVVSQRVIEVELSNNDIKQKSITTSDILVELGSIIDKSKNNNISDFIQSMINRGIKDSYVISRQNELIVADNKDLDSANNVIRINKNGMGFSKHGYEGPYEYGFTIDGLINASLISTGILSTILIQNKDGSLQIDLSGSNGIMTRNNGKNAIELAGTKMNFYNWDGLGEHIGQLYSARLNNNENVPGIVLANKKNSYLSLAYEQNNNFYSYIRCDKDDIDNTTNVPITFFENTDFRDRTVWFGYNINSIYNSTTNNFINNVKNNFIVTDRDTSLNRLILSSNTFGLYDTGTDRKYFETSPNETFFADANYRYFSASQEESYFGGGQHRYFNASQEEFYGAYNGTKYCSFRRNGFDFFEGGISYFFLSTAGNIASKKNFIVEADLTVTGNKNCVQNTENYGDVLYYSVEDCESYLTDRSMELFTVEETKDGTFERIILLDNVYKESINLDLDYTVEIIKQGWGDFRVKEQTKDYFIVESDNKNFTFKYVVTGKRKGFENERNKSFYKNIRSLDNKTPTSSID